MKGFLLFMPMACLLGFAVGSWGAREELEAYKKSFDEERKAVSRKAGGFDAFASIVKIPEVTRRPRKVKASAAKKENPSKAHDGGNAEKVASSRRPERRSVEDLSVRIEEAQELWRTRVEIARSHWKEKLNLSGEAERAFDSAVEEMNVRIEESISAVAELIAESESMPPELGLRLVGETCAIMSETYDKIGEALPAEMRSVVSQMQMVDFIDPAVASPLVGVQGKLENFRPPYRGGR